MPAASLGACCATATSGWWPPPRSSSRACRRYGWPISSSTSATWWAWRSSRPRASSCSPRSPARPGRVVFGLLSDRLLRRAAAHRARAGRAGLHRLHAPDRGHRQPGTSPWLLAALTAGLRLRGHRLERRPAHPAGRAGGPALVGHRGGAGARDLLVRRHRVPAAVRRFRRSAWEASRCPGSCSPARCCSPCACSSRSEREEWTFHERHASSPPIRPRPRSRSTAGPCLAAAFVIITMSIGMLFTLAIFLKPMEEAMGWSRSSISSVGLLNWVVMGLGRRAGRLRLRPHRHPRGGARGQRAPRARASSCPARSPRSGSST